MIFAKNILNSDRQNSKILIYVYRIMKLWINIQKNTLYYMTEGLINEVKTVYTAQLGTRNQL